jgi:hypothetical protein
MRTILVRDAKAPWFFDDDRELRFVTLSHHVEAAIAELRGIPHC